MADEKRLTERHYGGKGYYMRCSEHCRKTDCEDCEELDKLVDRLGELEDKEERRVDDVSVVHGRWRRRSNEMTCSKCRFIYYSNHDDFNYCPNCGAKMDGGNADANL